MKNFIYLTLALVFILSFTNPFDPHIELDHLKMPTSFEEIEYNSPIEIIDLDAAIVTGKLLFHMPANTFGTCANCHNAKDKGGFSNEPFPVGKRGLFDVMVKEFIPETEIDVQPVGTPSIMNLGRNALTDGSLGWQGMNEDIDFEDLCDFNENNRKKFDGVYTQVFAAFDAHSQTPLIASAREIPLFNELMFRAFGDRYVTSTNVAAAIGIFEKSFVSWEAPFQKYVRGEIGREDLANAKGMDLFMNKCVSCHSGASFGNESRAQKIGNSSFEGFERVTGKLSDRGLITVPSLYGANLASGYFHNEECKTIKTAIKRHSVETTSSERRKLNEFISKDLFDSQISNRVFRVKTDTRFN